MESGSLDYWSIIYYIIFIFLILHAGGCLKIVYPVYGYHYLFFINLLPHSHLSINNNNITQILEIDTQTNELIKQLVIF